MGRTLGIADRTDYDLSQHQEVSKQDLTYFDDEKKEKYIPYVIEPSLGADRMVLAFLCSAYDEEELEGGDTRTVMHFHPALAPIKIGVLPLSKKLNEGAEKYLQSCQRLTIVSLMTVEISESAIAVRMRSELRSVLHTT